MRCLSVSRLIALLLMLALALPALASSALIEGGKGVGKVRLGSSYQQVEGVLGKADRKKVSPTDPDFGMLFYDHRGIAILINRQLRVIGITVMSPRYATARSIRVGSSRSQVERAYGAGLRRGPANLAYPTRGLAFSFRHDKVTHIYVVKTDRSNPLLGDRLIIPGKRLGGIKLGEPIFKVRQAWGQPNSQRPLAEGSPASLLSYKRQGVKLVVQAGRIVGIMATTGDFITRGGIKVGATRKQVERAFGKDFSAHGPEMFYEKSGIGFVLGHGRVLEIQLIRPR